MRRRKSLIVLSFTHIQDTCLPINGLTVDVFVFSKKRERERDQKFNSRPSISFTFDFSFCCNDLLFSSKDIKKIQAISSGELLWRQKSISVLLMLTNSLLI